MFKVDPTPAERRAEAGLLTYSTSLMRNGEEVYAPVNRDVTQAIRITYEDVVAGVTGEFTSNVPLWGNLTQHHKLIDVFVYIETGFNDGGARMMNCNFTLSSAGETADVLSSNTCFYSFQKIGNSVSHFGEDFWTMGGIDTNGSLSLDFTVVSERINALNQGSMIVYLTWRQYASGGK